ncbi:MAG: inovirus-type Gp2 protein [Gallionella sp.]|jgi:hypothetical protein
MKNNPKEEIGDALSASTLAYVKNNDHVTPVITQEMSLIDEIRMNERFSRRLIRTKEALFSVKINKWTKRKYIDSTKMGGWFLSELRMSVSAIRQHYPMHSLNPFVELFIRSVEDRRLFELVFNIQSLTDDEVVKWVDVLNGCADSIRKEGNSSKFKKTMNDYQRLSNKNYRELLTYINALFNRYSRLLVIRLDFGYMKEHLWPVVGESVVQYEAVKKHWEVLLRYMKTKLPTDCMVGFCWKLEYGLDKSFHYHVLIFLDGSKVREDVTIARMIGEHWSSTITKGQGLYYNCNAYKDGYKACGIGMVNHDDAVLRSGLEKAALYMTKTDYYIKMKGIAGGRAFGKGIMPELKTETRGRPRATTKLISDGN